MYLLSSQIPSILVIFSCHATADGTRPPRLQPPPTPCLQGGDPWKILSRGSVATHPDQEWGTSAQNPAPPPGRPPYSSLEKEMWDTHYSWAHPCRGLDKRNPPLHATTPRGRPLDTFGSPGMIGSDDGRVPPIRDATNLTPPPPPHSTIALDR